MKEYNWKKILSHSIEEAEAIRNIAPHQRAIDNLCDFEGRIAVDGENYSVDMLKLLYLSAIENICSSAVIDFLGSIDNPAVAKELVDEVLLDIAIKQHKKTRFLNDFEKAVKKREKSERERGKPKKLCQYLVEDTLYELGLKVRLNLVTKKIEVSGYGSEGLFELYSRSNIMNILPTLILDHLKADGVAGFGHGTKLIEQYLFNIADINRFNPIHEMLEEHLNSDDGNLEIIYAILGISDKFDRRMVLKWFIQCVALAYNDYETQVSSEGVLVLQGPQGCGKTSFFRRFALKSEWFTEGAVVDVKNKDTIISAVSTWICELGEIDSTLKREQSAFKAFITRPVDRIRFPYAPVESELPRTTSLCGTVNPDRFLNDLTGARRYWVVSVESIAKKTLFSLKDEDIKNIWGYIYHLYKENPDGFRLYDEDREELEKRNRKFNCELKYEAEVLDLLDFDMPEENWREVTPAKIAYLVGGVTASQVGRILTKLSEDDDRVVKKKCDKTRHYILPIKNCNVG